MVILLWKCVSRPSANRSACALASVVLFHETAESPDRDRRPVSRQRICFDRRSEGRSEAVWTSGFGVDRIAAGEIDFFSGLPHQRHDATLQLCG